MIMSDHAALPKELVYGGNLVGCLLETLTDSNGGMFWSQKQQRILLLQFG